MKLLRPTIIVAAAIALVIAAHEVFQRSQPQQGRMGGGEAAVVTEIVDYRIFAERIEAIGTVSANESVTITPAATEHVAAVHFEDGALVEEGDVLVELEHAEESASLEEERVALREETRQFDRVETLFKQDLVSQEEFDEAKSALDAAQARYLAAEARLHDRVITAPFAGVVGIRRVSPGTLVSPGDVITTLDDLSVVKVDFTVPEALLARVTTGQDISARSVAWPDTVFRGKVTGVDTRVDESTRAAWVQARILNPAGRLRTGMLLTVELTSDPRRSVGIPEAAILVYGDTQYVYVVRDDNTAERRELTLGVRDVGWVEVNAGLEAGERLVVDGLLSLRDGARVREAGSDGAPPGVAGGAPPDGELKHP